MNPRDLILRKRGGEELTDAEIQWLISEYAKDVPDDRAAVPRYQMSAFLMATFFQGMNPRETVTLTRAMLESGTQLTWEAFHEPIADKHSTGGVGDKVSLVLAPLAACCGVRVPMLSGRGLGHTGGTLDKLEAMHGFSTQLPIPELRDAMARVGCAMAGQSGSLAPADKKIYALRDVTGTVECIPLIVASILSKKAAAGIRNLVFDLKCGDGAFMRTGERALELARALVDVATGLGIRAAAMVTNMDEPLGLAVGNALEAAEAIECLRGEGPPDLRELTLRLTAGMLRLSFPGTGYSAAYARAEAALADGSALRRFLGMVGAQGGEFGPDGMPVLDRAAHVTPLAAPADGFVAHIRTFALGMAAVGMGAGRQKVEDVIDPSVGVVLAKKVGDAVKLGEPLAWVHENRPDAALHAELAACFEVGARRVPPRELVSHVVTADGTVRWDDWAAIRPGNPES